MTNEVEWIVDVTTSYVVSAEDEKEAKEKAIENFIDGYEPTEDRITVRGRLSEEDEEALRETGRTRTHQTPEEE